MQRSRFILAIGLMASLAGCGGKVVLGGDPQLSVLDATELPVPRGADLSGGVQPYYVGAFDRLTIDVFGIDELAQRDIQVDANGKISYPLVGVIDVAGKTAGDVEKLLTERLKASYIRDPQVTVNIKEMVSRVVTVDGEVKRPGIYPVAGRMSLLRVIARAEGTNEFSKLDDVVIFRTVAGQRYAALYNLDAIRHGAYPDPEIYANDVVTVGDSRSRRLFKDILAVFPALATPIVIAVDRLAN